MVTLMNIALFTPYFNQPRGNSTTAKRLIYFLNKAGVRPSVVTYQENNGSTQKIHADFFHILHATRFVKWAKEQHFILNRPYIVTMGGTDINVDLQTSMSSDIFSFLNGSHFITVFTEDAKNKVGELHPAWLNKTYVIPQGLWLPWRISPRRDRLKPSILLPAGLRPVKDVLNVLPGLDEIIHHYPDMTFTVIGANLDEFIHQRVLRQAEQRKWFNYVGAVPHEVMIEEYDNADIIINSSLSEGQPLALMEAMGLGLPVIGRKNKANLQLILHEETGWLYETISDFIEAIHSIVNNIPLREKVVRQARESMFEKFSPEKEALAYLSLYKRIGC